YSFPAQLNLIQAWQPLIAGDAAAANAQHTQIVPLAELARMIEASRNQ
ncbi:MAG: hypothetical protein JO347_05835, partial [Candidatus Eremiobacteraeota bacterium]|nr:hypothetical protein [Candidatus Eremiobacteraeota bacterium]